jgi:hypothetical protein
LGNDRSFPEGSTAAAEPNTPAVPVICQPTSYGYACWNAESLSNTAEIAKMSASA